MGWEPHGTRRNTRAAGCVGKARGGIKRSIKYHLLGLGFTGSIEEQEKKSNPPPAVHLSFACEASRKDIFHAKELRVSWVHNVNGALKVLLYLCNPGQPAGSTRPASGVRMARHSRSFPSSLRVGRPGWKQNTNGFSVGTRAAGSHPINSATGTHVGGSRTAVVVDIAQQLMRQSIGGKT